MQLTQDLPTKSCLTLEYSEAYCKWQFPSPFGARAYSGAKF